MTEPFKYAVVIERAGTNYSAYVPDLPGCISVGDTIEEIERNIREAITLHLEGLREHGEVVPKPTTKVDYVDAH
jgi:predicted RNase H-like HicB family nuclease